VPLNPERCFLFFPPPLLVSAALFSDVADFHANLRPNPVSRHWLVFYSHHRRRFLAHYFIEGCHGRWICARCIRFASDAIAATAIAERLRIPRRIVTILEGENLVKRRHSR